MRLFMLLLFFCTILTAISQVLLKQSANLPHKSFIFEYLNWRVILSYSIFALVMLLNMWAYTKVPMKYGSVIDTCSYVFVLLFSYLILKERITRKKLLGNLVIILGVLIYTIKF